MTTYSVDFMYVRYTDEIYSDRIQFYSLEEAKAFIEKIKNEEVKKICYIYLTTIEKIIY